MVGVDALTTRRCKRSKSTARRLCILHRTPLLLIPGVGLLVLSTSARFRQLHEEFRRRRCEGNSGAVKHICQRAHLMHSALVRFLALSSLLGTIANRWFAPIVWVPQAMTFIGVVFILYAAIQQIRESKLLITVILDDAEGESSTQ